MPTFSPYAMAVFAALFSACVDVLYRFCGRRGCDAWVMAFFNSLAGGLLLLLLCPIPSLAGLNWRLSGLLCLSSVFWALMVICDIKAYQRVEAGISALLNSSRFVFINLSGLILFGESISGLGIFGMLLILGAIAFGAEIKKLADNPGLYLKMASVLCGTSAIVLDKYLTMNIDTQLVIDVGYLLPAVLYWLYRPIRLKQVLSDIKLSDGRLVWCAVAFSGSGYFLIHAFGKGMLWSTISTYEVRTVLASILAAIFLGEINRLSSRVVAACLCVAGVVIISRF